MTTGDYDPNAHGQPPGYPPPNPYGQPGYPPPPHPYGQFGYPPPPPPVPAGQPGGLGLRFAARLIDGILVGIIAFLLAGILHAATDILITGLFSGLLTFIYFVTFEVTKGWTPAKKLLGLSVHGPGGAPKPSIQQSAIRNSFTLLSIIPYVGGLLGVIAYIVIAVTINSSPTKQGKHDELAGGTQVLKS